VTTTISGTLRDDQYMFLIIYLLVLFRMRNISDKSWREIQNAHFMFTNFSSKSVPFTR